MNTKIVLIILLNYKWNHLSFESYLAVFIMIYFYIFAILLIASFFTFNPQIGRVHAVELSGKEIT